MEVLNVLVIIFNIISVYYAAKNSIITWYAGIIASAVLMYILGISHLYMSLAFNAYSLAICIIGCFTWGKKHKDKPITASLNKFALSVIATVLLSIVLNYFNKDLSDYPLTDSICTAMSFVAIWLLERRNIFNWLFWMISDALYIVNVGLFGQHYNFITIYGTMLILAIYGYNNWLKIYYDGKIQ